MKEAGGTSSTGITHTPQTQLCSQQHSASCHFPVPPFCLSSCPRSQRMTPVGPKDLGAILDFFLLHSSDPICYQSSLTMHLYLSPVLPPLPISVAPPQHKFPSLTFGLIEAVSVLPHLQCILCPSAGVIFLTCI